jgi:sn-glycerol 3-phosphate transport system ATP-binding protein
MQQGSPKEIYRNPQNIFVAQFIGDPGMNVFLLDNGKYVGFKPRGLRSAGSENDFSFEADLLTSEFLGFDYQYTFDIGIGKIVMRSTDELEPDKRYRLYVQDEDLFFFDKDQNVCRPFEIGGLKGVYHADG